MDQHASCIAAVRSQAGQATQENHLCPKTGRHEPVLAGYNDSIDFQTFEVTSMPDFLMGARCVFFDRCSEGGSPGIFQACDESGDGVLSEDELMLGIFGNMRHVLN